MPEVVQMTMRDYLEDGLDAPGRYARPVGAEIVGKQPKRKTVRARKGHWLVAGEWKPAPKYITKGQTCRHSNGEPFGDAKHLIQVWPSCPCFDTEGHLMAQMGVVVMLIDHCEERCKFYKAREEEARP